METPKPTVILSGPAYCSAHQKTWSKRLTAAIAIPPEEARTIRKILAAHRSRQTRKLGSRDEDPDPYDKTYIFYCLDGPRET
jgi:hypothetical protein